MTERKDLNVCVLAVGDFGASCVKRFALLPRMLITPNFSENHFLYATTDQSEFEISKFEESDCLIVVANTADEKTIKLIKSLRANAPAAFILLFTDDSQERDAYQGLADTLIMASEEESVAWGLKAFMDILELPLMIATDFDEVHRLLTENGNPFRVQRFTYRDDDLIYQPVRGLLMLYTGNETHMKRLHDIADKFIHPETEPRPSLIFNIVQDPAFEGQENVVLFAEV